MPALGRPPGRLRHGLLLPSAGYYAEPRLLVRCGIEAEESGWDGVYLWDHLLLSPELRLPVCDTWTVVTAILASTRQLRSGPVVTPLARRRPWKVARETVTLDHLSGGRLVLGIGLGALADLDFSAFGEPSDLPGRAARVDEAMTVIDGLWQGSEFTHQGPHYAVDRAIFLPVPTQRCGLRGPRIPVWVAAVWPTASGGALRRAARADGIVPMMRDGRNLRGPSPAELSAITAQYAQASAREADWPRDVVAIGSASPRSCDQAAEQSAAVAAAGATWRLESFDPWHRSPHDLTAWLRRGPPRAA